MAKRLQWPLNFPLGHKPTWRTGEAELELRLDDLGRPQGLSLKLHPLAFELLAYLPQLAPTLPIPADEAARRAALGHPISLGFEAPPELLAQLPTEAGDLATWMARFEANPAWRQPEAYRLVSLSEAQAASA